MRSLTREVSAKSHKPESGTTPVSNSLTEKAAKLTKLQDQQMDPHNKELWTQSTIKLDNLELSTHQDHQRVAKSTDIVMVNQGQCQESATMTNPTAFGHHSKSHTEKWVLMEEQQQGKGQWVQWLKEEQWQWSEQDNESQVLPSLSQWSAECCPWCG